MVDWGAGRYEQTAAELEPVAGHVVALAAPRPGERVLDVATGTGNAALLAARAGAVVTGIDTSQRLIAVARERAHDEGAPASFLAADMEALPFENGSFDTVLSVFGVIFAADPGLAFSELVRVLSPNGRAFLSAWVPEGPIDAMVAVFASAISTATAAPARERFRWHDTDAVQSLADRHGARVSWHEGDLEISASSPEEYLDANQRTHPLSVSSRPLLEEPADLASLRDQALAILRAANQEPLAFKVRSSYRIAEIVGSER